MQRCHAVPGKTSWIALEAPVGVVSDTDRVVDPPRARSDSRNDFQPSWDSVSMASSLEGSKWK